MVEAALELPWCKPYPLTDDGERGGSPRGLPAKFPRRLVAFSPAHHFQGPPRAKPRRNRDPGKPSPRSSSPTSLTRMSIESPATMRPADQVPAPRTTTEELRFPGSGPVAQDDAGAPSPASRQNRTFVGAGHGDAYRAQMHASFQEALGNSHSEVRSQHGLRLSRVRSCPSALASRGAHGL